MLTEAVPAALAAALYPPALLFVAYLLAEPRPRQRALVFLAGAVIATLGSGFALVFVLRSTGIERGAHHLTVPPWIDLGIGVLLLVSAIYLWSRPPRGPKAEHRREIGVIGLLGIGLVMYSPSPLYLAALHAIAKAHGSVLVTILGVVLVAFLYMLMVEIPVVAHTVRPEETMRAVRAVNTWFGRHGRTIIVLAAGAFGVYFVIHAIVQLISDPRPGNGG